MITIFSSSEVNFNHSGKVILPTSCVVTEELNGGFDLKMVHYYDELERWKDIVPYSIVRAKTPKGYQLFRIYEVSHKSTKGKNYLTAYARHIFYDNLYSVSKGISGKYSAGSALAEIFKSEYGFEVYSDIEDSLTLDISAGNLVKIIMDSGGVLESYSGNLVRDNFKIEVLSSIGESDEASNLVLEYGKNISGITYEIDISEMATRILPIGYNKNGVAIYLDEVYVDSSYVDKYFKEIAVIREYNNLFEEYTSLSDSQIKTIIREKAEAEFLAGTDLPSIRIDIDFVNNKNDFLKQFENIDLGDFIRVKYSIFDVDINVVCVKYIYDCCIETISSLELGERKKDFSDTFMEMSNGLTNLKNNYQYLQSAVEDIIGTNSEEE